MLSEPQRPATMTGPKPTTLFSDPRIQTWYTDLTNERRLVCVQDGARWVVSIDGRHLAEEGKFEVAVHRAYAMTRALSALNRARG